VEGFNVLRMPEVRMRHSEGNAEKIDDGSQKGAKEREKRIQGQRSGITCTTFRALRGL
jgi:hypothetical protein